MMLYRNMKVYVCSPDGDTNFFNIVAGVLHGDTLAPYLFIICLDYVLQMSIDIIKENSFTLKKAGSRQYSAKPITDTDYTYNRVNRGWWQRMGTPHSAKLQHYWNLTIRLSSIISRTFVRGRSYSSAEKQLVYSTAPADWATGPENRDSIPGRVIPKTQNMILDASLLNT